MPFAADERYGILQSGLNRCLGNVGWTGNLLPVSQHIRRQAGYSPIEFLIASTAGIFLLVAIGDALSQIQKWVRLTEIEDQRREIRARLIKSIDCNATRATRDPITGYMEPRATGSTGLTRSLATGPKVTGAGVGVFAESYPLGGGWHAKTKEGVGGGLEIRLALLSSSGAWLPYESGSVVSQRIDFGAPFNPIIGAPSSAYHLCRDSLPSGYKLETELVQMQQLRDLYGLSPVVAALGCDSMKTHPIEINSSCREYCIANAFRMGWGPANCNLFDATFVPLPALQQEMVCQCAG